MDVDEFMAFLETRPKGEHWDLIEGIAVMMAPPSYAHQRIAGNLCELLNSAFVTGRLDLYAYFNVGVRNPGIRNFQPEPDVAVVPGVSGYDLYSDRFQLVAEILSPSNTRQEIDLKLHRYREAPGQSLRRRDRAARIPGGDLRAPPRLGAGDAQAGRRSDRDARVRATLSRRRSLPRNPARSAGQKSAIAAFCIVVRVTSLPGTEVLAHPISGLPEIGHS